MSTGEPEVSVRERDLRELALRAREGDLAAAYDILGEQVPVETWVDTIKAIAGRPDVDLELVAHRTLRRPAADVASAVVDLARQSGTAKAAFVAKTVGALREEEHVVKRADDVARAIVTASPARDHLIEGRPVDALYAALAEPLYQQAAFLKGLRGETAERDALVDAARAEYERLQNLAKDTRWRSGSYRHALRHALADFALMAEAGGKLEDQAFRLLQQRTEGVGANSVLLAHLPTATRRAYLSWVLTRPAGKEETERTLFALNEVEARYPDDVDRSTIRRLLASSDHAVASAAVRFLVRTDPDESGDDRAIADVVARVPAPERADLVESIARDAPQRIRVDLWPPDTDGALRACDVPGVSASLVRAYEDARESEVARRLLHILLGGNLDAAAIERVAQAALARSERATSPELDPLLSDPSFRAGLWAAIGEARSFRPDLLRRLVAASTPEEAGTGLAGLHVQVGPNERNLVEEVAVDSVAAGSVAPGTLGPTALGTVIWDRAQVRLGVAQERLEALQELVSHGDRAAELELLRVIGQLVERAVERSAGNARLIDDYRRLVPPGSSEEEASVRGPEPGAGEVATVAEQLGSASVRVTLVNGNVVVKLDRSGDDVAFLRALAIADHRVTRRASEATETASQVRAELARALAESGLAERSMRDVVDGGPLQQAVTRLNASARRALFDAALEAGFKPPDKWRAHPLVGQWVEQTSDAHMPVERDPTGTLIDLQNTADAVRELEAKLADAREAARRVFVATAEPALIDLEQTMDAYVQLWLGLDRIGVRRIGAPGAVLDASALDPASFEVVGDAAASRYVVRSGGVRVGDDVLRRARVEAYD